ncbi:hypothetical protein [Granulicoccus phenolivorans]|uniref:hypothetical protein n=1 Tax=Granulicoccus phenolivorans TaxID=266854 RepID=UPI0004122988|nr:hypothetical protein [Granulicoccus phenolivorans]
MSDQHAEPVFTQADIDQARAAANQAAARYRVALDRGISRADADLFLTSTDEEQLAAQADALLARDAARDAAQLAGGNYVPTEGKQPKNQNGGASVAQALFHADR